MTGAKEVRRGRFERESRGRRNGNSSPLSRRLPGRFTALGTDGFGRSDSRAALRRFFEIDAEFVVLAALTQLAKEGLVDAGLPARAIAELGIDPEKRDSLRS